MVCSRQSIGWGGLWRLCCLSCQIFGAVRFEPKRSFLDSPRERRCSCAVDFWHIVVKPRRRKTTRTYYRFWKSRWNNESVCDASGLGGFVRRYLSTRSLRITSNFFRCTMYLALHSVLCHCLVKQHSRNEKKKKKICQRVTPVGSTRPRLYGLPKVHKSGAPLRPILSMCNSPQYALSKWLCELLKPVVKYFGSRCVKDTFAFVDSVRKSSLSEEGYMCSFDVVSLFTKVPLLEVIDICADALYRNDDIEMDITILTEDSFRKLMVLATSGVEFSFNDIMYRQVNGVAMGSPLGPALANIFVGYHEKRIPQSEWPELYHRFVDDVFSHFATKDESVTFFHRLNNLHDSLEFTMEGEDDGSLPFLDARVTRSESGMVTSVYRKPTFTGLYTPWDSFSPTIHKINLVRSLNNRAIRICSPSVIGNELKILRNFLLANGYPGHVLDRLITLNPRERFIGPKRCPLIVRLPWLGDVADSLVRKANDAVGRAYFSGEVRAAYNTNRSFNLPKDRIPAQAQSNVIYSFECRHCKCQYVGKTALRLSERISQHVPKHIVDAVKEPEKKRRGRPPKKRENPGEGYQSAIACHLAANRSCVEKYSDSDFKVLSHARNQSHLDVLEALYINVFDPVLCKQKLFVTNLTLFRNARTRNK